MHWKKKRAIWTLAAIIAPYFGAAFIAWDFTAPVETQAARAGLLFFTAFGATMTFTYPGWSW